jgi:sarcosine oxidase subunit beta
LNCRFDAIIIGAGIIGTSIALEMARQGKKPLVIDKNPAAGYGSTSSSCAIIRTHYSTLQGTALAWESLFCWRNWADHLGVDDERGLARFRQTGVLMLDSGGAEFDIWREHHVTLGIPYEDWDTLTLRERMPFLDTRLYGPAKRPEHDEFFEPTGRNIAGAFYLPEGGYISDPQLATHNVQCAAEANGSEFLFNRAVVEIMRVNGRCAGVTLDDGRLISAPVIVNAAGPHSFLVNQLAGVANGMNITTRPLRHEVHFVPAPEGIDFERNGTVISDEDVGGYCRPEVGNKILVGSQDPDCDPREWVDDPDHYDMEVSTNQWRAQVYRLALRIPDLPVPSHPKGIVDLYDVTEDWIPIYDKSDLAGFYLAVGTSGNQFKNAPVVGKLMAELITACENGHDHDSDPVRYPCKHIDLSLDLGFYSRLREINKSSSFSVLG